MEAHIAGDYGADMLVSWKNIEPLFSKGPGSMDASNGWPEPVIECVSHILQLPPEEQLVVVRLTAPIILFSAPKPAVVCCTLDQQELCDALGNAYRVSLSSALVSSLGLRTVNVFLALLRAAPQHHRHLLWSSTSILESITATVLYLDTAVPRFSATLKQRLTIVQLCLESPEALDSLRTCLLRQLATRESTALSKTLLWCLSYWKYLVTATLASGSIAVEARAKKRSPVERTHRAARRLTASSSIPIKTQQDVTAGLAEACMLCIERKAPVEIIEVFQPMFESLTHSELMGPPFHFVATVTRLLRRNPTLSLFYFARITTYLSVDLSDEAFRLVEEGGVYDIVKNDQKQESLAHAQAFLAAVICRTSNKAAVQRLLSFFYAPLLGTVPRAQEKVACLDFFLTVVKQTPLAAPLLKDVLADYFTPASYIVSRGCSSQELNEAARCKCLTLLGYYVSLSKTLDNVFVDIVERTMKDAKASDRVRVAALEALCCVLKSLKDSGSSVCPTLADRVLSAVVPLVVTAATKVAARHQGLLSLLALLRLDKLSALNKEKLVPAKLKRIFGAQDSFLNAESAIAKGHLAELNVSLDIMMEIFSPSEPKDEVTTVLGLPLLVAHPVYPHLTLGGEADAPPTVTFPVDDAALESFIDAPYGALFKSFLVLILVGFIKQLDMKRIKDFGHNVPKDIRAGILRIFTIVLAQLVSACYQARGAFPWSSAAGLCALKTVCAAWQREEPGFLEDDTTTLLTLIATHPAFGATRTSSALNVCRKVTLSAPSTVRNTFLDKDRPKTVDAATPSVLVPNVSRFAALLECILKQKEKFVSDETTFDPTGFLNAFMASLCFCNPRFASPPPIKQLQHADEAVQRMFAVILERLQQTKLPDAGTVVMFFSPDDRCFHDEHFYLQRLTAEQSKCQDSVPAFSEGLSRATLTEPASPFLAKAQPGKKTLVKDQVQQRGTRGDTQRGAPQRTKAQLEQNLLETQQAQRRQIKAQLEYLCYMFDTLSTLSYVNPKAVAQAPLSALVHQLLRYMECPITVTAAYKCTASLARWLIPPSELPFAQVAEALRKTALHSETLNSKFFDALAAKNTSVVGPAGVAMVMPVLNFIAETATSLPACAASLQFLQKQLSLAKETVDAVVAVKVVRAAVHVFPSTLYLAEPVMTTLCSLVTADNQEKAASILTLVAAISQDDDPNVRRAVVNALTQTPSFVPLSCCASYFLVLASDADDIDTRSIAQKLLETRSADPKGQKEIVDGLLPFLTGDPSKRFTELAAVALAESVKDFSAGEELLMRCTDTYRSVKSVSHRLGLILTLTELCRHNMLGTESSFRALFEFLLHVAICDPFLVSPQNQDAARSLIAALETFGLEAINHAPVNLQPVLYRLLQDVQSADTTSLPILCLPASRGLVDSAIALFFGSVAKYAKPNDKAVRSILETLLARIVNPQTPTREVQCRMATTITPLVKLCCITSADMDPVPLIDRLLEQALTSESFVSRNGNALALAASVKGLGIVFIKTYDLIKKLNEAASDKKDPVRRQGAILCIQSLSEILGRLFEPYVVHVLSTLLTALSDSEVPVRTAAQAATKTIMSTLSAHGVKLVLPNLVEKMNDSQWRTRVGSIEALGAMAHCAPKQLAAVLTQVVPQLCEAATHSNIHVKEAAGVALETVASVVTNHQIKAMTSILLSALQRPGERLILENALDALLQTTFTERLDSPSLSLVCPIVVRALRERNAETKRKATAIVAAMVYMCQEPKDFLMYYSQVCPPLFETLLDPIPDVRAISARALGTIAKVLDEDKLGELLSWLLEKLKTTESSVERSGAAHGVSEVLAALGVDKLEELLPNLLRNAEHAQPGIREGYLGLFVFIPSSFGADFQRFVPDVLPVLLRGLSSEVESLREVAFRAAEVLVGHYAATHSVLLLTPLEDGLFTVDWRIRYSSVSLLGTLVERLLRCDTHFKTGEAGESEILSVERRAYILSSLYLVRSDESPIVRQQATQVWKAVVQNTPKTLKEILPILLRRIISNLSAPVSIKQEVSASCIGDLAEKFPAQVAPYLIPQLLSLLAQQSAPARYGGCIGLSQALCHMSRTVLSPFRDGAMQATQKLLCDTNPAIRDAATECLTHLVDCFGADVVAVMINDLVQNVLTPPTYSVDDANDPLRGARLQGVMALFETHHQPMLHAVIPACTKPPFDVIKLRLIGTVTSIKQPGPLNYAFSKLFPSLVSAVALVLQAEANAGTPNDAPDSQRAAFPGTLSAKDSATLLFEALLCAQKLYQRMLSVEGSLPTLLELLYARLKNAHSSPTETTEAEYAECAAAATLLGALLQVLSLQALLPYIPQLLQRVVPYALTSEKPMVVDACVMTLSYLAALLKQPTASFPQYVNTLRDTVASLLIDPATHKERVGVEFVGLEVRNAFDVFYALYHAGLTTTDVALREAATRGFGDFVSHCPCHVLKPYAVKITGPLIRAAVERTPAPVKAATLTTLRALIQRAGGFLRPLVPQLQISFCKALSDPAPQVRQAASMGITVLAELPTVRIDPLVYELVSNALTAQDPAICVSLIQGASQILNAVKPWTCSSEIAQKLRLDLESLLSSRGSVEAVRTVTTECLALVLARHTPVEQLSSYLRALRPSGTRCGDLEGLQTVGLVLSAMLLVENFLCTLAAHQTVRDTFTTNLHHFLTDERLGIKRYGVIIYTYLIFGSVKTQRVTTSACVELLPAASDAIEAFVDISGVPTLLVALKGLKTLAKYCTQLSLEDRIYVLSPTIDSLTLPHPAVKLLAEKVLYHVMEVSQNKELDILNSLEDVLPQHCSAVLNPDRLSSLASYTHRVLSRMQKPS